jgi:zinc transport system ATP-binding protein
MIARALVSNPDVLLLDEPTAGIDSESQESLKEVLDAYKKNFKTIILVTHELEVLEPLVDRVVVLGTDTKGSIIYDGKLPIPKHLYSIAHHSHEDSVNSKSILGMNNS